MSRPIVLVAALAALAGAAEPTVRSVRLTPAPLATGGAVMTASVAAIPRAMRMDRTVVTREGAIVPGFGVLFPKDISQADQQLGGGSFTFECSREKKTFTVKLDKASAVLKQQGQGFAPITLPLADRKKLEIGFPYFSLYAKYESWLGLRATTVAKGSLDGENFVLIDDNLDGALDVNDGIAFGSSMCFAPLAKQIATKKGVYSVGACEGGKIEFTPVEGDVVACTSLFAAGEPSSVGQAAIANSDGSLVAVLAGDKTSQVKLPAGAYKLLYGAVYGPKNKVMAAMIPGKSAGLAVEAPAAGKKAPPLAWGGPFVLGFRARIANDKLVVDSQVDLFGAGQEQYIDYRLIGTPVVYVNGKQNGSMGFG